MTRFYRSRFSGHLSILLVFWHLIRWQLECKPIAWPASIQTCFYHDLVEYIRRRNPQNSQLAIRKTTVGVGFNTWRSQMHIRRIRGIHRLQRICAQALATVKAPSWTRLYGNIDSPMIPLEGDPMAIPIRPPAQSYLSLLLSIIPTNPPADFFIRWLLLSNGPAL